MEGMGGGWCGAWVWGVWCVGVGAWVGMCGVGCGGDVWWVWGVGCVCVWVCGVWWVCGGVWCGVWCVVWVGVVCCVVWWCGVWWCGVVCCVVVGRVVVCRGVLVRDSSAMQTATNICRMVGVQEVEEDVSFFVVVVVVVLIIFLMKKIWGQILKESTRKNVDTVESRTVIVLGIDTIDNSVTYYFVLLVDVFV
jgi:hypothetical protein